MIIQLLNATVSEAGPSDKQFLQCFFLVDGEPYKTDIQIIKKGNSKFLVLDRWEDLFQGQDEAFQKMREWLFLPLRGLPVPEDAFIELEGDVTDELDTSRPGFF